MRAPQRAHIHDDVSCAVRQLQFEDIVSQTLGAAHVHLDRLQDINQDAIHLQAVLANLTDVPEMVVAFSVRLPPTVNALSVGVTRTPARLPATTTNRAVSTAPVSITLMARAADPSRLWKRTDTPTSPSSDVSVKTDALPGLSPANTRTASYCS